MSGRVGVAQGQVGSGQGHIGSGRGQGLGTVGVTGLLFVPLLDPRFTLTRGSPFRPYVPGLSLPSLQDTPITLNKGV